jgi:trigger factor
MKLPELDEEFAKSFGAESLEELKKWVRSDLESQHEQQVKRQLEEQVRQYLLDNTEFDLPERLSERQAERMMTRRMLDMYQQGMPQAEIEKIMDNLRASAREEAVRDLKLAFIMEKLAEQFDVHVSEEEINARIAGIAQMQGQRFDRVRDELSKRGGLQNLYINIRDEKLIQQLIDKANVTEEQPSQEDTGERESE